MHAQRGFRKPRRGPHLGRQPCRSLACPGGYLHSSRLGRLGKRRGYVGLLSDLAALGNVLRSVLPEVEGHCGLSETDLDQAEVIAERFLHGISVRHAPLLTRKQAAHRRDRAFALLCDAYNQARRAVQYLYWRPGEVDWYAPTLCKRQQRPKGKQAPVPLAAESPETALAPIPVAQCDPPDTDRF